MAIYAIKNASSLLTTVEFGPVPEGNFAFFTVRNELARSAIKQFLTSPSMGQELIGEAVMDGKPMLITRGNKSREELLDVLNASGNTPQLVRHARPIDTWRVISLLAVPGQVLQLSSSLMRKNKRIDWGLFFFATSNLVGHAITWVYGAQKSEDNNRLNYVKTEVNATLDEYRTPGETLPAVSDTRKTLREETEQLSFGQKIDKFLRHNSIYVGEIACRYTGALALAFPANRVKWAALKSKSLPQAYEMARNESTLAHLAGLTSVAGKTTSLMAQTEDPYDTKPKSALENFREKIAFRAGGWMEAGAFGTLTYDALTNPNRRIVFRGKEYRDYVGGLGSALFTARYVVRNWAKFGEKQIDMDEVYAHTTDALAKMPKEKLSQLLASTAAAITSHFKDKNLDYGEVYTRLMNDLYSYHKITVEKMPSGPESHVIRLNAFREPQDAAACAKLCAYADNERPSSYVDSLRAAVTEPLIRRGA